MDNNQYRIELQEAIAAADDALDSLDCARKALGGARLWGVFDILEGGLFSTLIKRSKMNDAEGYMRDAQTALHRFARELRLL